MLFNELNNHWVKRFSSKHINIYNKLYKIEQYFKEVLKEYKPNIVILEDIHLKFNVKTYKILAMLLGVLVTTCINEKVEYKLFTPAEWRSILKIPKIMSKKHAVNLVFNKFNKIVNEDEAEAICIGLAYISNN
jgi:Holliday junction resolvasome RuvABC endonuclease subunit